MHENKEENKELVLLVPIKYLLMIQVAAIALQHEENLSSSKIQKYTGVMCKKTKQNKKKTPKQKKLLTHIKAQFFFIGNKEH